MLEEVLQGELSGSGFSQSLPSSSQKKQAPIVVFVQLLSCVQLFVTPWTAARQASMSFTISWSLLKLMSTESAMLSNHLILCLPLFSCPQSFPGSVFPMNIQSPFPLEMTGLISVQSSSYLS